MIQKRYFVLLCMLFFSNVHARKSAITFTGGGRLGDKLISYCKAKWLAYKYDLDFLCADFPMKESLKLDKMEKRCTKKVKRKYKKVVDITEESDIDPTENDVLYISPFHIKPKGLENGIDVVETLNKYPDFLNYLRKAISPVTPQRHIKIPENAVSVAVHIRRGGGYDQPLLHGKEKKEGVEYADVIWPKRFPPDEYYIEQLRRVALLYPEDQLIYVHLFTDDAHPEKMVEKYSQVLGKDNIQFGFRFDNQYKATMLEDLFGMTQFDCIIRSTSSFSFMATLLGHHTYMIWPKHHVWDNNYLTIDRVWKVERHPDGTITKLSVTIEYDDL